MVSNSILLAAVGRVLDWDFRGDYSAVVSRQLEGAQPEQYSIAVSPRTSSLSIADPDGRMFFQVGQPSISITTLDGTVERGAILARVPGALAALSFPLTLPIWGRQRDPFRIFDAEEDVDAGTIDLLLAEEGGNAKVGMLRYSRSLEMCTEIRLPYERMVVSNVVEL